MSFEKLDLQSPNLVNSNIEKIAALFPHCVTETAQGRAIDFDLLKQELSEQIVDGTKERYRLEWPGKREAIVTANLPTNNTLRPIVKDSVNFDTTENIYIEGDNLEVLKLLQESYLGKIKMIYIDPPYNTGKDFVYKDNFTQSTEDFKADSGLVDEFNQRLVANPDTSGRYHSDWLTMMYPRLKLARNLLTDDGVIFISIDNYEVHNLRKICDEVFGEGNFLSELIWSLNTGTQAGHFTRSHESVLAYTKIKETLPFFKDSSGGYIKHGALKKISPVNPPSEIKFEKGKIEFEGEDAIFNGTIGGSEQQIIHGDLIFKNGLLDKDVTITAGWGMKNQVVSWLKGNETFDSKGQKVKRFYFNSQGILFYEKERGTQHPKTVLSSEKVGNTKRGGDEIFQLFNQKIMDFPKPTALIGFLSSLIENEKTIILDFFSGSATTAHAVMQLNAEDGGNRKYIMVQLPETTDEKSEAYKAGYQNICEIGKERIRRAGKKIVEELQEKLEQAKSKLVILNEKLSLGNGTLLLDNDPKTEALRVEQSELQSQISELTDKINNLDVGFRVYRLDSSNMKDVYYTPNAFYQSEIDFSSDNVKEDRNSDDLVAQIMLDWGLPLSLPLEKIQITNKEVFRIAQNSLLACFDKNLDESFARTIAQEKPLRVVFRDSSFKDDTAKENVKQLLKQLSPNTEMRVI